MTAPCLVVAVLLSPVLVTVALAAGLCGAVVVAVGVVGIAYARRAALPAGPAGDDLAEDLPDPAVEQPTAPPADVPGPVWDLTHLMHSPDRPLCGGRPGCLCETTDRDIYRRYAVIVAAQRRVDADRRARERRWEGRDV